jgi:hypothetical protein
MRTKDAIRRSGRGVKLAILLHLVSKFKNGGAVPPFSHSSSWRGAKLIKHNSAFVLHSSQPCPLPQRLSFISLSYSFISLSSTSVLFRFSLLLFLLIYHFHYLSSPFCISSWSSFYFCMSSSSSFPLSSSTSNRFQWLPILLRVRILWVQTPAHRSVYLGSCMVSLGPTGKFRGSA